jgi:tetratricopeptide (TPR) repeat protein
VIKKYLLFSVVLLLLWGCGTRPNEDVQDIHSASIALANDSINTNPLFVKNLSLDSLRRCGNGLAANEWQYLCASACFNLTEMDSTLWYALRVITYCRANPTNPDAKRLEARTQNLIANYYGRMSNPDSALHYYRKALAYFSTTSDVDSKLLLYINMADASIGKGNYPEGLRWYRTALYVSDSTGNRTSVFPIYSGLGRVYMDLKDYQGSEHYYTMAEASLPRQPLIDQYIYSNNRGNLYYFWKKYPQALHWFNRAMGLVRPGGYEFHIQLSALNLADTYLHLGRLDSAAHYAEMGKVYFQQIQQASAAYYNTTIRAGIALKRGRLDEAKALLTSLRTDSNIDASMVSIRNKMWVDYNVRVGDYRRAYEGLTREVRLNDSLLSQVALRRAATYDMQYKLDTSVLKRNAFINSQRQEIKTLRLQHLMLMGGGLAFLLLVLAVLLWMRKKKDLREMQYKEKLSRMRLNNIRNRISPHFIFNVLNGMTVGSMGEERRSILIHLLRKSLEMTDKEAVALEEELDFVRSYIDLERYNLGDDFCFQCQVDEGIDLGKVMIPPLFIQIPVENAIKHGLKPLKGPKRLDLCIVREKNGLRISIIDNGIGLSAAHPSTQGTSTGMRVLGETIDFLRFRKKSYTFTLHDRRDGGETGVVAELFIPFEACV